MTFNVKVMDHMCSHKHKFRIFSSITCYFRYKYFSQLKSLKLSEEKQPLGRMLSVPSPLPSAEGVSRLGELQDVHLLRGILSYLLTQRWIPIFRKKLL